MYGPAIYLLIFLPWYGIQIGMQGLTAPTNAAKYNMMRLKNIWTAAALLFFTGSLLSCNEGAAFREAVKPVVYADSISSVPFADTMYNPAVLPRHIESDFAAPLYPLLPLSISEEPTWEYSEETN